MSAERARDAASLPRENETVVCSLRDPEQVVHLASQRCHQEAPHPIEECGEFDQTGAAATLRALADRQAASLLPTGDGAMICLSAAEATRLRALAETLGRVTPEMLAAVGRARLEIRHPYDYSEMRLLHDVLAALAGGTEGR